MDYHLLYFNFEFRQSYDINEKINYRSTIINYVPGIVEAKLDGSIESLSHQGWTQSAINARQTLLPFHTG